MKTLNVPSTAGLLLGRLFISHTFAFLSQFFVLFLAFFECCSVFSESFWKFPLEDNFTTSPPLPFTFFALHLLCRSHPLPFALPSPPLPFTSFTVTSLHLLFPSPPFPSSPFPFYLAKVMFSASIVEVYQCKNCRQKGAYPLCLSISSR